MSKKMNATQRLRLMSDIQLALNYFETHKWVTGSEFVVINDQITSTCAIGAIRGGVYNGGLIKKLDFTLFAHKTKDYPVACSFDTKKTVKALEKRYNNVVSVLDDMTIIRTKGDIDEVYRYNDDWAKRKRDVVSLFLNGKKAVAEGLYEWSSDEPVPGEKLRKKLSMTWADEYPSSWSFPHKLPLKAC